MPEANSILGTSTAKEAVNLFVQVLSSSKIFHTTNLKSKIRERKKVNIMKKRGMITVALFRDDTPFRLTFVQKQLMEASPLSE